MIGSNWNIANPGAMAGMGYGAADPYGYAQNLTPEQQQQRRRMMYAQALMGQAQAQPQWSGWGALSNATAPILGAAMARWGGQQAAVPTGGVPMLPQAGQRPGFAG